MRDADENAVEGESLEKLWIEMKRWRDETQTSSTIEVSICPQRLLPLHELSDPIPAIVHPAPILEYVILHIVQYV